MCSIRADRNVFKVLRERIIFAKYYPGQVLPIRELEKDLGVSATPIREALVRLEDEGLVQRVPNSSARVKEVSLQDIKDIFELRLILVECIGPLAAQRIDEEKLSKMQDLVRKITHERSPINIMQLDTHLHDIVYDAVGNHALTKVAKSVRDQIIRLWFIVKGNEHVFSAMIDDWKRLYKALKARNETECTEILREHVLKFIDEVKDSIGSGR